MLIKLSIITIISLKENDIIFVWLQERLHFVIIGTVKCESRVCLRNSQDDNENRAEIKEISELHIFGKTL